MRVSIIKDSGTVNVDGEGYPVDCTGLPADFHALQWDGTSGEIEYRMVACSHCGGRNKKPNLFINDMTSYLPYVDAWTKAKEAARVLAEVQAEAAALAAAQAKAAHDKAMADAADEAAARAAEKAAANAAG